MGGVDAPQQEGTGEKRALVLIEAERGRIKREEDEGICKASAGQSPFDWQQARTEQAAAGENGDAAERHASSCVGL